MNIRKLFDEKKCVYSFEVFPPKTTSQVDTVYDAISKLSGLEPDYISVTYGAGGNGGRNTAQIAKAIKEKGIEPLAHLTCMGNAKSDIEEEVRELRNVGVENILALRGDRREGLPEGEFAHANELAAYIKSLAPEMNIAGACYAEGHIEAKSRVEDIKNLRYKIASGVTHLNSQLFFDNDDFFEFMELLDLAGIDVPVQAGIMPIVKPNQINRIVSMAGVKIPSRLSRLIARYGSDEQALFDAGIAYATEQIADLIAGGVRGIHVYVMNNAAVAKRITENVRTLITRANN